MEKVLLNEKEYELVANGYQFTSSGGKLIIHPGESTFEEIETDAASTDVLVLLDSAGEVLQKRTGLIYTGNISKNANYVIGTEEKITENNEDGEVVTELQDVYGTVYILEYRVPDLAEKVEEIDAEVDYIAMMTGVDLEV